VPTDTRFAQQEIHIMKKLLSVALVALFGLTGCMQIEYGVALEEDLSGTADIDFALDMDRMAYSFAMVQKMFSGEEGAPTEEEIAAAREEILAEMEGEDFSEEEMRADIEKDLPEGVELIHATQARDELKVSADVKLRFDHVTRLNELHLDAEDDEGSTVPGTDAELFRDLQIVDEGGILTIRNSPVNPIEETEEAGGGWPGLEAMMERAFEDLSIVFKIEAPFEIIEHNATRREGRTLFWEYDVSSLKQGTEGILVRYRK